ncbi:FK506-binding protein 2B [Gonapodya sp. JEL0774]|nr:FK506-binding protein 2B [Gonapodya sp. JEL0774]
MAPERPWTDEQLKDVGKKDLIHWIQENATLDFLKDHKLNGKLAALAKSASKDDAVKSYLALFDTDSFRSDDEPKALDVWEKEKAEKDKEKAAGAGTGAKSGAAKPSAVAPEPPKYTKQILTKGDASRIPRKGDTVGCMYTGTLTDGKVFDSNMSTGKKGKGGGPLKFKVGTGRVIRGWDEALLTMGLGEKQPSPSHFFAMNRLILRIAPTLNLRAATFARAAAPRTAIRAYSSHNLDPESHYDAFVSQWAGFFKEVDDEYDFEVGLNEVFVHDWVPALSVVEEALKAARRLNSFPTAVRILEGIEERAENKSQYEQYLAELKPLLTELGVPTKAELGIKV